MFSFSKKILPIFLAVGVLLAPSFVLSQTIPEDCSSRQECEALLKKYEEEINKYEREAAETSKKKKSLRTEIYLLRRKINKLSLELNQSSVLIKETNLQIGNTEDSIRDTSLKIENYRKQLIDILRTIRREDRRSMLEIFLSENKFSDFFTDLTALESLNLKNQEVLKSVQKFQVQLQNQEKTLFQEKDNLESALKMQLLQKEEAESAKKKKGYFLKLTEAQYKRYLKEKSEAEKKAAQIRARIFKLVGIPQAPTFGQAYKLAKEISSLTGIEPAFLLAVLHQESSIGRNVGQCLLKNAKTGSGVVARTGKKVSRVMNPRRDVPYFLTIAKKLGRDPYNTLLSCPMSFGWGGAMGPAQFIPSTWARYSKRIEAITNSPSDPWSLKDAFLAAALYLTDYGAKKHTYSSEWRAAMIYFSGSTNSRFRFYGDSVMRKTAQYREDIRTIE